jgi:hypothetical protein
MSLRNTCPNQLIVAKTTAHIYEKMMVDPCSGMVQIVGGRGPCVGVMAVGYLVGSVAMEVTKSISTVANICCGIGGGEGGSTAVLLWLLIWFPNLFSGATAEIKYFVHHTLFYINRNNWRYSGHFFWYCK